MKDHGFDSPCICSRGSDGPDESCPVHGRPVSDHELGDIFREITGRWVVACSCGWVSTPWQQRTYATQEWTVHAHRAIETELVR